MCTDYELWMSKIRSAYHENISLSLCTSCWYRDCLLNVFLNFEKNIRDVGYVMSKKMVYNNNYLSPPHTHTHKKGNLKIGH